MVKLIVSDMDGTLLDEKKQIPQKNIEAIRYAQSKGIEFMVATGRNRQGALPMLEAVGIECPMIALNGAQVFDKAGSSVLKAPIERALVEEVLLFLEKGKIYYEILTNQGVYSQSKEQRIENWAAMATETMPNLSRKQAMEISFTKLEIIPITFVKSIRELIRNENITVFKINYFYTGDPSVLKKLAQLINKNFKDLVTTSSDRNNLEITYHTAQKGLAIAQIAKEQKIALEEVMVIGDNLNDISMFQVVENSFAMGNSLSEVKKQAKYVTGTNNDGGAGEAITYAIDKNL
ncbi:Cof-type HAD-IIB family hydrolase [Tetragenococcus solitarius]|uniref:Cof-type HAD-IIB family hydrolase n=1 Tax=Tetragenococcus solitarius TaxID=71453 RepID=A0ABN3Y3Q9_9ENTE|nr:Cof-type HAD-IIB family hydrolase [Tetragenococcus solitarius]